jgi:hypothetical protein
MPVILGIVYKFNFSGIVENRHYRVLWISQHIEIEEITVVSEVLAVPFFMAQVTEK